MLFLISINLVSDTVWMISFKSHAGTRHPYAHYSDMVAQPDMVDQKFVFPMPASSSHCSFVLFWVSILRGAVCL